MISIFTRINKKQQNDKIYVTTSYLYDCWIFVSKTAGFSLPKSAGFIIPFTTHFGILNILCGERLPYIVEVTTPARLTAVISTDITQQAPFPPALRLRHTPEWLPRCRSERSRTRPHTRP